MNFNMALFLFSYVASAQAASKKNTDGELETPHLNQTRAAVAAKVAKILDPKARDYIEKQWTNQNEERPSKNQEWQLGILAE